MPDCAVTPGLAQQAPEFPRRNAGQREKEVEDHGKRQSAKDANRILLVKVVDGSETLTAAYDQGQTGRIERCSGRGDHNREPPLPTVSAGESRLLKTPGVIRIPVSGWDKQGATLHFGIDSCRSVR